MNKNIGIGIDLGTCNSCVALYHEGKQTIVLDELGNNIIPTSVLFLNDEILFGETAMNLGPQYPKNWIKNIKRIIGKTTLEEVSYYNKQHLYNIVEENNDINIVITCSNNTIKLSPDEIIGLFFGYLRKQIGKYISLEIDEVIDAVITIPAYFTETQRQATIKAAELANIKVLRLINEPTAAALSYLHENKNKNHKNLVIFDMGGGTLDITLLNVASDDNDQLVQVIATVGDSNLGGNDLTKEIMLYVLKEIKKINQKIDLQSIVLNDKIMNRITRACEVAKLQLSTVINTSIIIEELFGNDYNIKISKSIFEDICNKYFVKCTNLIKNLLDDSEIKINDIDDIILVGGPCCMPVLSTIIQNKFNIIPKKLSNPKYSVCVGASIYCNNLLIKNTKVSTDLLIIDVTPLRLGVEVNGTMCTIIDKNTKIPCSATKVFSTEIDNQRSVSIKVYQGNNDFVNKNQFIGKLTLSNIPAMLKKMPKILVKFSMDCSGTLNVVAKELVSSISISAVFDNKKYNILAYDSNVSVDDVINLKLYQIKKNINDYIASINKYLKDSDYRSCIDKEIEIELVKLLDELKFHNNQKILNENDISTLQNNFEHYKQLISSIIV